MRAAGTFTNVDNGNVATSVDKVLNKDLKVIDNGDGTLTVILLATGNAMLYDASGKAIGRNPGSSTGIQGQDSELSEQHRSDRLWNGSRLSWQL